MFTSANANLNVPVKKSRHKKCIPVKKRNALLEQYYLNNIVLVSIDNDKETKKHSCVNEHIKE